MGLRLPRPCFFICIRDASLLKIFLDGHVILFYLIGSFFLLKVVTDVYVINIGEKALVYGGVNKNDPLDYLYSSSFPFMGLCSIQYHRRGSRMDM